MGGLLENILCIVYKSCLQRAYLKGCLDVSRI